MARTLNRLTKTAIDSIKKKGVPGYHHDGGGLYLQVGRSGAMSWVFRYERHGRRRELGLGSFLLTPLAAAREKAIKIRMTLGEGREPVAARTAARAAAANRMTFSQCAEAYINAKRHEWANPKHADQWQNTLDTYAKPIIGNLDVAEIDTHHVVRVLEPIWTSKTETASRLRGRIEQILAWATIRKYRTGDNPARWRGHLQHNLARPSRVKTVTHHSALPYAEVGAFMKLLALQEGIAARALEFAILTTTRTSEVICATWEEVDMKAKIWTIPAERMKAGKEHRVPLSDAAMKILTGMIAFQAGVFVFPGGRAKKPLSNMAMLSVLKRMERSDLTVHGFRSTFRDWVAETTTFPRELAEKALAHTLRSEVEAAYQRGDMLAKRARMMQTWASYCGASTRQRPASAS